MQNPPIQFNYRTGRGGEPLMPQSGGIGRPVHLPYMGAPHVETAPAGYGPIQSQYAWGGQGFDRSFFLSPPVNPSTGPNKLNAVWVGDVKHGVWIW